MKAWTSATNNLDSEVAVGVKCYPAGAPLCPQIAVNESSSPIPWPSPPLPGTKQLPQKVVKLRKLRGRGCDQKKGGVEVGWPEMRCGGSMDAEEVVGRTTVEGAEQVVVLYTDKVNVTHVTRLGGGRHPRSEPVDDSE